MPRKAGLRESGGCGSIPPVFTLRHMDADLLRFDWLPDRGGRQEVRIDRVFPAAARFLPLDLRPSPTDEALGRGCASSNRSSARRRRNSRACSRIPP